MPYASPRVVGGLPALERIGPCCSGTLHQRGFADCSKAIGALSMRLIFRLAADGCRQQVQMVRSRMLPTCFPRLCLQDFRRCQQISQLQSDVTLRHFFAGTVKIWNIQSLKREDRKLCCASLTCSPCTHSFYANGFSETSVGRRSKCFGSDTFCERTR